MKVLNPYILCGGCAQKFRSGLLKKRPAGQIRPAEPLKVARGKALKNTKYRPNGTRHVPDKWPLFWANPTPRFFPVLAAYTKWSYFSENLHYVYN